jgi:quinol monooxygenase YgiN
MTETPIVLNVHFLAAPGQEKELGSELLALVAPSRAEPGCLAYELHFDPEHPGKFMFYEKFASQAALDQHLKAPYLEHFRSYLKANNPIAAQTVTRWSSFSS